VRRAKVYLAGAGPGDPELLTVKAVNVLKQADVVIYDRLVSAEVLAVANPAATFIYAGKAAGQQERIQSEIYGWILRFADSADTIVRLKSGDPSVFGRSGEELEFLAEHGIEAEIIPGISSALAGPARANIPLTYRGTAASFAVIAGHREGLTSLDWSVYRGVDTLVVLMGVEHRDIIAAALIAEGRSAGTPVAFIENASTENERTVESTLGDVARRRVDVCAPAVFVIGEVVRLRERLRCARLEGAFA
jgi:uroporphyrin-III C-methyltransferase